MIHALKTLGLCGLTATAVLAHTETGYWVCHGFIFFCLISVTLYEAS